MNDGVVDKGSVHVGDELLEILGKWLLGVGFSLGRRREKEREGRKTKQGHIHLGQHKKEVRRTG
jgi:hypothetical protein